MTAHESEHDRLRESTGLYVLGALAGEDGAEFERHLAVCPLCADEVRSLGSVAAALPHGVALLDPPASLRARVLTATRPAALAASVIAMPPRSVPRATSWVSAGWLSAAAMLVVTLGLGAYAGRLREQVAGLEDRLGDAMVRLDRSEQQVAVATRAVSTAEGRLAVLTAPDMRQVDLEGQPVAPGASGRAFWSRSRGLVFTASDLPPLPAGRIYQLWMVLPEAPVSAGLLEPDTQGRVAQAFSTPADVPTPVAIAVTDEPEGGVAAPSGARYLIGFTH